MQHNKLHILADKLKNVESAQIVSDAHAMKNGATTASCASATCDYVKISMVRGIEGIDVVFIDSNQQHIKLHTNADHINNEFIVLPQY